MSFRIRFAAFAATLALLAGSAVLVSSAPAGATVVSVTVTSNADLGGTCPSANNCTLRQALTNANQGGINDAADANITIAPGLGTIAITGTLMFNGGANLSNSLTITGNGATILGSGSIQLSLLSTTGDTYIDGLTFSNGNSLVYAGAIDCAGPLSISNSTFTNNHSIIQGGAINAASALTLTNVDFSNNQSQGSGGAITASGPLTISDASFTGNTSPTSGGAILAQDAVSITRSTFNDNTADGEGGAITATQNFTISDSSFLANTVVSNVGQGGALNLTSGSGTTTVHNTVFNANVAPGKGGAIFSGHNLEVSDSSFRVNSSNRGSGGAIYSDGTIVITNASFTQNLARYAGAVTGTAITIDDSVFSENIATIDTGAVYGNGLTIHNSVFDRNTASRDYGVLNSTANITVEDSSFTSNSASRNHGLLIANGSAALRNTTIANNSAQSQMISTFGALSVSYSTITGNSLSTGSVSSILLSATGLTLFGNVLDSDNSTDQLCSSTVTSNGYNYANDTSCGLNGTGDNQNVANDPMLGTVGDHGGFTLTSLPLVGSPLINAIPNAACQTGGAPTHDQRGYARPTITGGRCDIGAVQLSPRSSAVVSGSTVTVTVLEFTSLVTVTLHSDPIELGTIAINGTGSGTGTFELPCAAGLGDHTIVATSAGGQIARTSISVTSCRAEVVPVFSG